MPSALDRLAYAASQGLRRSWFYGHYLLAAAAERRDGVPAPRRRLPGRDRLRADLEALFERDWAAIAAGLYATPHDLWTDPRRALAASRAFLADLASVSARRRRGDHQEVARDPAFAHLPRYYRQNFHYQTDGWLSERSARLYDFQVEVLFSGGADAMRRGALIPIGEALARAGPAAGLLDIGCGTGRFLTFVKDNWPRLAVLGVDLSPAYLAAARRNLRPWRSAAFAQAAAERLPLRDAAVDVATCVYLLHELPPGVRRRVAAEAARVLRPGGRLVVVDSLQHGDRPDYDALLDRFPDAFHEPYFASWLAADLPAIFAAAGLVARAVELRFLTKIAVFDRPAA
ncbi:MAG: class I SAM-dependent methyltransferase [Alphaproteobacteria bacterium]|nr:class I SAM-dependent methyltransferase [Alphaproteobacteria bacterium]